MQYKGNILNAQSLQLLVAKKNFYVVCSIITYASLSHKSNSIMTI